MTHTWICGVFRKLVKVRRESCRSINDGAAGVPAIVGVSCAAICAAFVAPSAHAGADCSISTPGANFGTYDLLGSVADDTTAAITVTCSYVAPGGNTTVNYTIAAGNGLYGTSATTRKLGAGTARLGYNVYRDSARSQVLGTGTAGTVVATGSLTVGTGSGNSTRTATHTFYARSPAAQDVGAGTYLDSLVLTLTY